MNLQIYVQGTLQVSGKPVFQGLVTTRDGLTMKDPGHWEQRAIGQRCTRYNRRGICTRYETIYDNVWVPGSDDPQFLGGYQTGVDIPMSTTGFSKLTAAAESNGFKFPAHDTVYIKFQADTIKYKYSYKSKYTAAYAPTLTLNGTIFAQNAVVHVQGTVKGQYTLGVSGTASKGKVFIDDDLLYNSNPDTNPNSTDLLGIVAQNDVMITDNTANRNNINIYASIFSQEGGFGADKYDTRPPSGSINLHGGICQYIRRAVGTFSGSTITHGFSKTYLYDNRLRSISPPFFPDTGRFQLVSWYD